MFETKYISSFAANKFWFSNYHFHDSGSGSQNDSIGYLIKGNVEIKSKNAKIKAREGQMIFIPKGEVYTSHWYGSPEIEFYSLRFNFYPSSLYENRPDTKKAYRLQTVENVASSIKENILELFGNSYESIVNPSYMELGMFYLIYNELTEIMHYDVLHEMPSHVSKAVLFIENNISIDYDVAFLARLCNMSESGFYDNFKKITGYTPIEYKNRVKVQKAAELLTDCGNTVEMISQMLNFSSPSYFRRIFSKYTGLNPSEFRNRITL